MAKRRIPRPNLGGQKMESTMLARVEDHSADTTSALTRVMEETTQEINKAATSIENRPEDYGKTSVKPPEGTPDAGVQAHRNIIRYGEAGAQYLERLGADAVKAALEYQERCKIYAASIREEAKAEAERAAGFTTRIRDMAQTLDAAVAKYQTD